jgi:hypothetical protein
MRRKLEERFPAVIPTANIFKMMNTQVRYFTMKLALKMLQRCLADASFGKEGEMIQSVIRTLDTNLEQMKAFQNQSLLAGVLQCRDTIIELGEKLTEGDWEQLSVVMNLLSEVTAGNVLIVEKEEFQELEKQLDNEGFNVPQL